MAFEYDVYSVAWGHGASTAGIVKELNKRGGDGWQLVGMTRDESPEDDHDEEVILFVFCREKKGGAASAKKSGKKGAKKKKK
ncbi:MAG: hypothetical protein IPG50_07870 [Myxococcales bacterium]|nr:hypothetical protein [Myxococcales bacterium]